MGRTTIVICTLAEEARAASLWRAIASVFNNALEHPRVVVVVNGSRYAPALLAALRREPGVDVVQLPLASLAAALLAGRQAVQTPFFGFLDDDDEYLPGALDVRLDVFDAADDRPDIVVSNGFRRIDEHDEVAMSNLAQVSADPLGAILRENWLASCGGLFRTDTVAEIYFHEIASHLEWTWLGYTLALDGKRVAVLDVPTFRIHDTAGSASKTPAYHVAHVGVLTRMLRLAPNRSTRQALRRRLASAHHMLADAYLKQGLPAAAARHHLSSLRGWSGLRYLSFSRHFLHRATTALHASNA